jgi:hypothetical protein
MCDKPETGAEFLAMRRGPSVSGRLGDHRLHLPSWRRGHDSSTDHNQPGGATGPKPFSRTRFPNGA